MMTETQSTGIASPTGLAHYHSGELENTMTTTSIHPGHSVSGILNNVDWDVSYTPHECARLDAALVGKFEELARLATGDDSISYCAYTSEITYECWGQTTREHHCLAPKTKWKGGEILDDEGDLVEIQEIEWGLIAQEAGEWVAEHIEDIIGEEA